jgi:hypothetical protein
MGRDMPFKPYLKSIEQKLQQGQATEHTHRAALQALLEALSPGVTVVNEPRRIACGVPDLLVSRDGLTVGYLETKDVGLSLDRAERSDQLKRYCRSLENLILTDYLEFRWYVDGEPRQTARMARVGQRNRLVRDKAGAQAVLDLLGDFLSHAPQGVDTPRELAERMARLTHLIRDVIVQTFERGQASNLLQGWRSAFARVLVADLDQPDKTAEFADMFAQTLAYGLFSARLMDTTPGFDRQEAQRLIPRTNPFLREFFYHITGPQLDDEPYVSFVDDLAALLAHTDMAAVLADFGKRTRQEDPVVHFYETFLAAYDPRLREMRGVYYTPEPVVSYIVRSVDHLLKTRFDCPQGLADTATVTMRNLDPGRTVKGKRQMRKTAQSHKVLILDPATGTGTFLYAVVDHIRRGFMERGDAGMWSGYVREHLLPRLFGFELLMAPYAVAHFKLALQLAGYDLSQAQRELWAYDFGGDERVGVYLTNALEGPHEYTGLPLFTQFLADETQAANQIKQDHPIMVVIGNPPYAVSSANKGEHIERLMDRYKQAVKSERAIIALSDDYIKFIRFAHDRIERTGHGIIGMITNHSYLSGLIHRGMREELMRSFTSIYILNLHGNSLLGERSPDGSEDQNVFDIRQGVAIALMVKEPDKEDLAQVWHADLWGRREDKYSYLTENDVTTVQWQKLEPATTPYFFFVPKDFNLVEEYEQGWRIPGIFSAGVSGVKTHRDKVLVDFERGTLMRRFNDIAANDDEDELKERYGIKDTNYWTLTEAREHIMLESVEELIQPYFYRTFDQRYVYYNKEIIERGDSRWPVMRHMLQENVALVTVRQLASESFQHVFVTQYLGDGNAISLSSREYNRYFPLYLYIAPKDTAGTLFEPSEGFIRQPNLSPKFIAALKGVLGLGFVPDGQGDLQSTFGPEDILHYAYAIFHAPTYRTRYAEFLKIDFPRLPLTADVGLFRRLCALGRALVGLHLLESPSVSRLVTRYPLPGEDRVGPGYPRYFPPGERAPGGKGPLEQGRVYLNKTQYFEGVAPEVWAFQVGGYQVLHKWLKDRRGRQLSFEDLMHYQKVVVALKETIHLMAEVDAAIPGWPIE